MDFDILLLSKIQQGFNGIPTPRTGRKAKQYDTVFQFKDIFLCSIDNTAVIFYMNVDMDIFTRWGLSSVYTFVFLFKRFGRRRIGNRCLFITLTFVSSYILACDCQQDYRTPP